MPLTPEQQAREEIDRQLEACGWDVQDLDAMDIHARLGVAVREYRLKWKEEEEDLTGFADYLLYAKGRAIGIVEVKRVGHTLEGVVIQSKRYTEGLDEQVPAWHRPLPFAYESTGEVTQFTNGLDPHPRSREIFTFHRPEELLRLQDLGPAQLRRMLREMPELPQGKLWPVQHEAIANLERSLVHARPRALIQMATGSGKTFTVVSACHRPIRHARARRILFLVDRNNLGRQTLSAFVPNGKPVRGRARAAPHSRNASARPEAPDADEPHPADRQPCVELRPSAPRRRSVLHGLHRADHLPALPLDGTRADPAALEP